MPRLGLKSVDGEVRIPLFACERTAPWGGEVVGPRFHDHVEGPVKGAALKATGERRDVAVRLLAGNARQIVLANGQSALEVARQTVGTISRLGERRCGWPGVTFTSSAKAVEISTRTGGALLAVLGA